LVLASFAALLPVPSERSTIALPVAHPEWFPAAYVTAAIVDSPTVPNAARASNQVEHWTPL
jgi:hypothetical protein